MDPALLQAAFRLGFVILALSLLVLPFEDRTSAEFVATVLSAVIGFVFVGIVTVLARSSLPPPPRSKTRTLVDKGTAKGYNETDSHSGGKQMADKTLRYSPTRRRLLRAATFTSLRLIA